MRLLYLLLAFFLTASLANADISNARIKAYNEAVNAGSDLDAIVSASVELAEAAIENPDDENASLLAFEAAWMLCQTGNCGKGAKAAQFAADQPATAEGVYPSLQTRELLSSFITWKTDDTKANRETLVSKLANLNAEDVSQISVTAHREHFLYCASKGAWRDAEKAAAAAAMHTSSFKSDLFDEYAFAELTRITSAFSVRKDVALFEDINQLKLDIDTTLREIRNTNPEATPETLDTLGHRTTAWEGAIGSYFYSVGLERKIEPIKEKFSTLRAETPSEADQCPGGFDRPPRIRYPESAAATGRVGSVVAGLTIKNGEPVDIKILAAVPEKTFDREVIRALKSLKWELSEEADPSKCTPDRENIVYPFVFSLN